MLPSIFYISSIVDTRKQKLLVLSQLAYPPPTPHYHSLSPTWTKIHINRRREEEGDESSVRWLAGWVESAIHFSYLSQVKEPRESRLETLDAPRKADWSPSLSAVKQTWWQLWTSWMHPPQPPPPPWAGKKRTEQNRKGSACSPFYVCAETGDLLRQMHATDWAGCVLFGCLSCCPPTWDLITP